MPSQNLSIVCTVSSLSLCSVHSEKLIEVPKFYLFIFSLSTILDVIYRLLFESRCGVYIATIV